MRLTSPVEATIVVRGSRFLAALAPVADESRARAFLERRAERGPDATHHCWACRVWRESGIQGVGFDAGEPSGTAGRPILGALDRADAVDVACVVSRWFGGTKLGTGGLARAYAASASAALETARAADVLVAAAVWTRFRLAFDYSRTASVRRVAARYAAREAGAAYGERVALTLDVPAARAGSFRRALGEATAGGIEVAGEGSRIGPAEGP